MSFSFPIFIWTEHTANLVEFESTLSCPGNAGVCLARGSPVCKSTGEHSEQEQECCAYILASGTCVSHQLPQILPARNHSSSCVHFLIVLSQWNFKQTLYCWSERRSKRRRRRRRRKRRTGRWRLRQNQWSRIKQKQARNATCSKKLNKRPGQKWPASNVLTC